MRLRNHASVVWIHVTLLLLSSSALGAKCDLFGDVDESGVINVADVQCGIITALWSAADDGSVAPFCLLNGEPVTADLSCNLEVDVSDVQLSIVAVLGASIPAAIDADGSGCPDLCEAGPVACTVCDDSNPCTSDLCGPDGCIFEPLDGTSCDDGDACTTGDTCTAGVCLGEPVVCEADEDCQHDRICDPLVGCRYDSDAEWCSEAGAECQGPFCFVPGMCGDNWCDASESPESCSIDCAPACDGETSLCARPLSELTLLGTHASAAIHPETPLSDGARQQLSLIQQAKAGVRYFDFELEPCASAEGLCVVTPGTDSEQTFDFVLARLLFTAQLLEFSFSSFGPARRSLLIMSVRGATPAELAASTIIPVEANLYSPTDNPLANELDLSLQNLANRHRGVMLFHNPTPNEIFVSNDELPAAPLANPAACVDFEGAAPPDGALYVVPHFRSFDGIGSRPHAACMNAPAVLAETRQLCSENVGRPPNVLLLDFAGGISTPFAEAIASNGDLTGFAPSVCPFVPSPSCPLGGAECSAIECIGESYCAQCLSHEECDAGLYCDPVLLQCVPTEAPGSPCFDAESCGDIPCSGGYCTTCSAAAPCPEGQVCLPNGVCTYTSQPGGVCEANANCPGGFCAIPDSGAGVCVLCLSPDECDAGLFCEPLEGCVPRFEPGEPCSTDDQCTSGFCAQGTCGDCGSIIPCEFGSWCAPNGACELQHPGGAPCQADDECRDGLVCRLGSCKECQTLTDCGSNQYCQAEQCFPQRAAGGPCNNGGQCLSGFCGFGKCGTNCSSSNDCESGEACEPYVTQSASNAFSVQEQCDPAILGGTCVGDNPYGTNVCFPNSCLSDSLLFGVCGDTCTLDTECAPADGFCQGFICMPQRVNSQFCDRDAQCLGGVCFNGTCSECATDDDCHPAMHCVNKFLVNECVDDQPIGGDCNEVPPLGQFTNVDCYESYCTLSGTCVECIGSENCGPDQYCTQERTCLDKLDLGQFCSLGIECLSGACDVQCVECGDDSDCNDGEFCATPLLAINTCTAQKTLGESCGGDSECLSGDCSEGSCAESCQDDSQCASSEFCEPLGKFCKDKFGDGSFGCTAPGQCESGICTVGLCADPCSSNVDCDSAQYCDALLGTCVDDKANGTGCLSGEECASGVCDVQCTECTVDSHCEAGQFCKVVVAGQNECTGDEPFGSPCTLNAECVSGVCGEGVCQLACDEQADCPTGQYCAPLAGFCKPERDVGDGCLEPFECASGFCDIICIECEVNADCGENQFCNDPLFGAKTCETIKPNGEACAGGDECESGICDLICVECVFNEDCAENQFCKFTLFEPNFCVDKVPLGEPCTQNAECTTNACSQVFGTCGCTNSEQCAEDEWCDIVAIACTPKKEIGGACLADVVCLSGVCDLECVECVPNKGCEADEWCDVKPGTADSCEAKRATGQACGFNAQCQSELCSEGLCSTPCETESECSSTEFCEPLGKFCKAKFSNGFAVGCTADVQCISGACLPVTFTCVECETDASCSGTQYCQGNACQSKKGNGASCGADNQCLSETCGEGSCETPCTSDATCPSGQFCEPLGEFCKNKFGNGFAVGCTADNQCLSGACLPVTLTCVECESNANCGGSQFCQGDSCQAKKGNGQSCGANAECLSGTCGEGTCETPCSSDASCPSSQFCEPFGNFCKDKFGNGFAVGCTADNQCLSGACLPVTLTCVECESDANCGGSQFCQGNQCVAKASDGANCGADNQCISGKCGEGKCVTPCTSSSNCDSSQFCEPLGNFCKAKFDNGFAVGCTADNQCLSGACLPLTLTCVECESNGQCSSGEICSGNSCVPKKATGQGCLSGSECVSNICDGGTCVDCVSQSDCSSGQYCNIVFLGANTCQSKKGAGSGCANNFECSSNNCSCTGLFCTPVCQ